MNEITFSPGAQEAWGDERLDSFMEDSIGATSRLNRADQRRQSNISGIATTPSNNLVNLPSIELGLQKSPLKGFLDVSTTAQKLRKNIKVPDRPEHKRGGSSLTTYGDAARPYGDEYLTK